MHVTEPSIKIPTKTHLGIHIFNFMLYLIPATLGTEIGLKPAASAEQQIILSFYPASGRHGGLLGVGNS